MYRQHNLEYFKNIKYMRLFTAITFFSAMFFIRTGVIYGGDVIFRRNNWTIFYIYERNFSTESCETYSKYGWEIYIFIFYGNILPSLSLIIVHVCFKPDDDILQGVNKLDHLLKVSYF